MAYDLSAFAGGQVEIALTYVTDPFTGGVGAFVDDTRIVVDGVDRTPTASRARPAAGRPRPPPAGSPPTPSNWVIGPRLLNFYAATSTNDTLLLGFGFEQLATDAERNELMSRALNGLLVRSPRAQFDIPAPRLTSRRRSDRASMGGGAAGSSVVSPRWKPPRAGCGRPS